MLSSSSEGAMCMWIGDGGSEPVAPPSPQISLKSLSLRLRDKIVDVSGWCITICISCIDISVIDLSGKKSTQKIIIYVSYFYTTNKVIHPKYSKHWPYTLAPKIDCGCSKMLNHGLNHVSFSSTYQTYTISHQGCIRLTHTLLQRTLYSKGTLCFSRA